MEFGQEQDRQEWLQANDMFFRKRAEARIGCPGKKLDDYGQDTEDEEIA